jgi:uncharacterized protein (DUF1778 family)
METPTTDPKVVTLRIQTSLDEKVDAAASTTGLKRSDVLRLAIDRGLDVLLSQLGHSQEALKQPAA